MARVCRKFNEFAIPCLYRSIIFRVPRNISASDALLSKLETLSDFDFKPSLHTLKVALCGTWYREYDVLESQLGGENLLSPAVRMLNSLLSVCLAKMPHLKSFTYARLSVFPRSPTSFPIISLATPLSSCFTTGSRTSSE
jgi:hypothetical protein